MSSIQGDNTTATPASSEDGSKLDAKIENGTSTKFKNFLDLKGNFFLHKDEVERIISLLPIHVRLTLPSDPRKNTKASRPSRIKTTVDPRDEKKSEDVERAKTGGKRPPRPHKPTKKNQDLGYEEKQPSFKFGKFANENLKKCWKILQQLKKHRSAQPFLEPVDVIKLNCPDYPDVIKDPMDLGTVEKNLKTGVYTSIYQFCFDVNRVWKNSFLYNKAGTDIHRMTKEMNDYFEKLFKEFENQPAQDENELTQLQKQVAKLQKILEGKKKPVTSRITERPMSLAEKKTLGHNIRKLSASQLRGIVSIINENNPTATKKDELIFDIDTLPTRVARELERYVKGCLNPKTRKPRKGPNLNGLKQSQNMTSEMLKSIGAQLERYDGNGMPQNTGLPDISRMQSDQYIAENQMMQGTYPSMKKSHSVQPNMVGAMAGAMNGIQFSNGATSHGYNQVQGYGHQQQIHGHGHTTHHGRPASHHHHHHHNSSHAQNDKSSGSSSDGSSSSSSDSDSSGGSDSEDDKRKRKRQKRNDSSNKKEKNHHRAFTPVYENPLLESPNVVSNLMSSYNNPAGVKKDANGASRGAEDNHDNPEAGYGSMMGYGSSLINQMDSK
eukprot:CAMPEP_0115008142 /NCGR_PEP_ID=MMETSP0216-20121206/21706_1 /TAXON_ID=223996 /ORGANISM="Protocruzia adherens, Strain Boccale" /LENGTH=608 /DNA_ID=CAMNT_0002375433 /DNA_START=1216 /DNA_END=3042 /DNA_ORIENTATION=+